MTALDDLGAWLTGRDAAMSAAGFAQGAASRQAEVDAGIKATNDLNGTLVALRAKYDAYVKAHPDAPTMTLVEFKDFADQNNGLWFRKDNPPANRVFQMAPKSSTKASVAASGSTCPLRLVRLAGTDAGSSVNGLDFGNFDVRGNDQGHVFHGVTLGYSNGAKIHDGKISGIPGTASSPPGETFTLEAWRANNVTLTNLLLDGRRDGTPVAATLLGYNYTSNVTATNVTANYAAAGFAVAMYQCTGTNVFTDCDFRFCRKAINIEQANGGTYEFNRCDFRGTTGAPYAAQISAQPGTKSTVVTFRDPVVDSWPLKVRTYPEQKLQADSDIHCFVGGVDVTNDPTRFLLVHNG